VTVARYDKDMEEAIGKVAAYGARLYRDGVIKDAPFN
jgi:hypothetical protein